MDMRGRVFDLAEAWRREFALIAIVAVCPSSSDEQNWREIKMGQDPTGYFMARENFCLTKLRIPTVGNNNNSSLHMTPCIFLPRETLSTESFDFCSWML
eukprot:6184910-Pleurochrysis_carterae.AAC.3